MPAPHALPRLPQTLAAAALLGLLATRPAAAIVFQNAAAETAGLGAGQAFLDPEARLIVTLNNSTQAGCSASLLAGGEYLLTAAHCLTGDSDTLSATSIAIDFANVDLTVTATTYYVDPTWDGVVTNGGDLALIQLSTAITSIIGYTLDTASLAIGDVVTLAGYGETGVGSTGATANSFGTLYYGQNEYDGVYSNIPSVYAYDFDKYGTNAYNVYGGPAVGTDEALIAPGDSGGASLIEVDGTWEIVGVHDFTSCVTANCTPNSTFGQIAGDTSVYADAAWLESILVPEPASAALLGAGLLGLVSVRRRKRAG